MSSGKAAWKVDGSLTSRVSGVARSGFNPNSRLDLKPAPNSPASSSIGKAAG